MADAPDLAREDGPACRYFTSYRGIKPPVTMVEPIPPEGLTNRNTYFVAWFDEAERLTGFDKMVYGGVELSHRYTYHPSGAIASAEIVLAEDDPVTLYWDESGEPTAAPA